jgi:hypothetical protein
MNGERENLITMEFDGPASEQGHVRLDEFIEKLEDLITTLNGIDRLVGETAQTTLYYRIVAVSHSSPLTITIEPVVKKRITQPAPDHIKTRHHRFFRAIKSNEPISPDLDDRTIERIRDLVSGLGETFERAVLSNAEARIELDRTFETNVRKLLDEEDCSYGGFEGMLDAANIHGETRRFWLYPRIGAQRVRCDFLPGTATQIREAMGRYIRVEGFKYFRAQSPFPYRVKVRHFEPLEADNESALFNLGGIAPSATGEMTSVDFVRAIRDEWD